MLYRQSICKCVYAHTDTSNILSFLKLYITIMEEKIGLLLIALSALLGGSVGSALAYEGYDPGWYTLFHRHHCSQGDLTDGGCFLNNVNDGQIRFTNDSNTNEWIMKDIINSQGSGHFIPNNLANNFNDIASSINTKNFSNQFQQCVDLRSKIGASIPCEELGSTQQQGSNIRIIITPGQSPILPNELLTNK